MENCDVCFKIICKKCGWQANNEETKEITVGKLTSCPVCNWSPTSENLLI